MAVKDIRKLTPSSLRGEMFNELSDTVTMDGDSWLPRISGPVIDHTGEDDYNIAGLASVPKVRKFLSRRVSKDLVGFTHKATPEKYEITVRIRREDFRRNNLGIAGRITTQMNTSWQRHWAELTLDSIDANTLVTYDGLALFHADHLALPGGTEQPNIATFDGAGGTLTVPALNVASTATITVEEASNILAGLMQAQMDFTDDEGRRTNTGVRNWILFVPLKYMWAFRAAIAGRTIVTAAGGLQENLLVTVGDWTFTLVATNDLDAMAAAHQVALVAADGQAIIRMRDPDSLYIEELTEGSDHAFINDEYLFGIMEKRYIAGLRWQSAIRGTLS